MILRIVLTIFRIVNKTLRPINIDGTKDSSQLKGINLKEKRKLYKNQI